MKPAVLPALCLTLWPAQGENIVWEEMNPMPLPRAGYIAGVVGERLLLAGGTYWEGDRKRWSNRTDFFDPVGNQWVAGADLPTPRADAACAVHSDKLYVFGGGAEGQATADALIFNGKQWTSAETLRLPAARIYPVAALLGDRVFVIGGLSVAGDYATAETTVWSLPLLGPARQTWTVHESLPGPKRSHFALASHRGRLYVFGGMTAKGSGFENLDDAYEFDPSANRWKQLPRLPVARRAWWGMNVSDGICLFGGYTDKFESEIFHFNPASGQTTLHSLLPRGVADAKFFPIRNTLMSAGGESGHRIRAPWALVGRKEGH